MAYNKGYNPDALPAHVEPEQAAAYLSTGRPSNTRPPPSQAKPQPPLPSSSSSSRYDDRYGRQPQQDYGRPPPPQDYGRPPPAQDYGRPPPRHDSNQAARPPTSRLSGGGYGSPPPQSYAYGSLGPPPQAHGRPPTNRPPPVSAPPRDGNDRDALWPMFKTVDKDGSGQLSEAELSRALVNGDWSPFDTHTVRMMIRMFDADRNGLISFDEFCGLWGFLAAWRNLFDRFDADHSGNISYDEFEKALVAFGYRLSSKFVSTLFRTYDRRGQNAMSFDLFVQACISLKRMTDVFKKYDEDRDGYITLSFEEFLTEIIKQMD